MLISLIGINSEEMDLTLSASRYTFLYLSLIRRKAMLKLTLILFMAFFMFNSCSSDKNPQHKKSAEKWISLFNGKNLDGWTIKISGHKLNENYKNTFRAENGILKISYDQYDKFDGEVKNIFYKDKFSNYKLRLEYRFTGEQLAGGPSWGYRNNGIMLHGQTPESMELDQDFPVSIEMQLLGGDGSGPRPTRNVCTPGTNIVMDGQLITRHCTNSTSKTYDGEQWVKAEVIVRGSKSITHIINGDTVLYYEKPQLDKNDSNAQKLIKGDNLLLNEGTISLQAESHPTEFRNIELLILDE